MYSVSRGSDLGTNLVMGEYKNSALAKLWKKVVANKKTVLTDISLNEASNENYALIGTPVFDNNGELECSFGSAIESSKKLMKL